MEEIFSLKVENADGKFWRRLFEYFFHDQPKLLGGSFDLHFPYLNLRYSVLLYPISDTVSSCTSTSDTASSYISTSDIVPSCTSTSDRVYSCTSTSDTVSSCTSIPWTTLTPSPSLRLPDSTGEPQHNNRQKPTEVLKVATAYRPSQLVCTFIGCVLAV